MAAASVVLTPASADTPHPTVVSDNPANYTPALVEVAGQRSRSPTRSPSGQPRRRWRSLHDADAGRDTYSRQNLRALLRRRRRRVAGLNANNRIWAAASRRWTGSTSAAHFTAIGGTDQAQHRADQRHDRPVDPGFTSAVRGRVERADRSPTAGCYAGGSFTQKLVALNLETGANTGRFNLAITDQLPELLGQRHHPRHVREPAGHPADRDRQLHGVAGRPAAGCSWRTSPVRRRRSTRGTTTGSPARAARPTPAGSPTCRAWTSRPTGSPLLRGRDRSDPAVRATWTRRSATGSAGSSMANAQRAAVDQLHRRRQRLGGLRHRFRGLHPGPLPVARQPVRVREHAPAATPSAGSASARSTRPPGSPCRGPRQAGADRRPLAGRDRRRALGRQRQHRFNGEPRHGIAFAPLP